VSHPFDALSPDRILDAVEAIGLLPSGHVTALNSYENRVYQIGIEDADPLIAKFYRPGRWSDETILEEHDFSLELAAQEIPVIPPKVVENESLFHFEGFRFAVFARRGGRAPDPGNLEQLEWIGRLMGRIHAVGRARSFQHRPKLDPTHFGQKARDIVVASPLLPEEHKARYSDLADHLLLQTRQLFDAASAEFIRIHGDCHIGNILWSETGPRFVDLDDCVSGPAIQDLWMLLNGDIQTVQLQLHTMLEGYRTFCDFNPAELTLIEPLRGLRLLHYTAWLAHRWDDPAFPLAFPWFGETRYWENHLRDLQEQSQAIAESLYLEI